MRTRLGLLVSGLLPVLLAGCGYTFGSGLEDRDIHTVAIRVVANETFRQRFERDLTAAVERTLVASSGLLPASEGAADAVLEVTLTDAREQTLVVGNRTAPVREGSLDLAARVVLRSRRDGQILVDRTLLDRAEFRDPIGEDLTSARSEAVSDLARKIVLALETSF